MITPVYGKFIEKFGMSNNETITSPQFDPSLIEHEWGTT